MNRLAKSQQPLDIKLPNFNNRNDIFSYNITTGNIEVTVWPEFIDSQINPLGNSLGNLFVWAYHIRIDNHGDTSVKLLNRHWKIIDENGEIQEIDGKGVIGEQPNILPQKSFQYSSGVHLKHPSGIMTGFYEMKKENGEIVEVKIPAFSLDLPSIKSVIN